MQKQRSAGSGLEVYMIEDCRYAQKQNGLELFRHLSGQLQLYNSAGSAAFLGKDNLDQ